MTAIAERLSRVLAQIRQAESAAGRMPGSVRLLAVSKTKPAEDVAEAYHAGQRDFGESYLQEALAKQHALVDLDITWHFIGPIQSNKTKLIATHFDWVHSVDRLKIASRLSEQRPETMPPLKICLQVNISDEASKSGVSLANLPELVEQVLALPNIRLHGVMTIPQRESDFAKQRQPYQAIYQAVQRLGLPQLDTFSFGMSGDLTAAIAEGSTIVRIGTALFGPRTYS